MVRIVAPKLLRLSQDEFTEEYWDYEKGQHVSFFGPTGSGKTTLQFKLLNESAAKKLPGIVLVVKPRDETVDKWNEALEFKRVEEWPSLWKRLWNDKTRGWLIWPKHEFNAKLDNAKLTDVMGKTIMKSYRRGDCIIVADETYGLSKELRLDDELVAVWSKGRSMGAGLWSGTQRPAYVPGWMYNQASHVFIANDADERARKRYGEIGGNVDPKMIDATVRELGLYEFLYIQRSGSDGRPRYCVLTP